MLVRAEGVSDRSAVPVSLRTESVLESSEPAPGNAGLVYRRKYDEAYRAKQRVHAKSWYWRNRETAVEKQRERRRAKGIKPRQWRTPGEDREWRKQWRERNKDKCKEYRRKWNSLNKDKVNAQQRSWRERNKEAARLRDKKYRKKYCEKLRIAHRKYLASNPGYNAAYHRKQIENLADWYVRARMSRGTNVPPKLWPDELVELQKTNIKLKRLWQNQPTSQNSETNS